jgi:TonB family protein
MKFLIIFSLLFLQVFAGKKEVKTKVKPKSCEKFLESYHSQKELTKKPFVKINFKLSEYYPKKAKEKNIRSGETLVQVFIDKTGTLTCSKILKKSEGYGFDAAALKIIKNANFKPGEIDEKKVDSYAVFPVKFSLDE